MKCLRVPYTSEFDFVRLIHIRVYKVNQESTLIGVHE